MTSIDTVRQVVRGLDDVAARFAATHGHAPDPRALEALHALDLTADRLVLWMPGTGEKRIPGAIRDAIVREFDGVEPVKVAYEASGRFARSVPDGEAVLLDTLRGIELLRSPGQEVYLAGHSQGAWVATNVMNTAEGAAIAPKRMLLFGHPSPAVHHYPQAPREVSGTILEVNHPRDAVARTLTDATPARALIDPDLKLGDRVRAFRQLHRENPGLIRDFASRIQTNIPIVRASFNDPHGYVREADDAVRWLRTGNFDATAPVWAQDYAPAVV